MNAVDTNAGSGNVFADLGLPDADDRFAKAELAHEIWALIRSARLTQAQAARRLGVDQPKVSALLRGRLKDFSIERLLRFPNRPPSPRDASAISLDAVDQLIHYFGGDLQPRPRRGPKSHPAPASLPAASSWSSVKRVPHSGQRASVRPVRG
jgi:predicted XRE-type DNA-binding protein